MFRAFLLTRWRSCLNPFCPALQLRCFSLQDASTALRPFFFMVHPDFFGQHPTERVVNENSLKLLNEYLASYKTRSKPPKVKEILFYIRKGDSLTNELKLVKIPLDSKNLREIVVIILQTCGLSDQLVPKETKPDYSANRPIDWHPSYYTATGKKNPHARAPEKPVAQSLRSWLRQNVGRSRDHSASVKFIKDDIQRLLDRLRDDLKLDSIRCDSVWGLHNFRGCLKSFDRLCSSQPYIKKVLEGRTLVFSNATGVSRTGEVILSGEDVPEYWYSLLVSVPAYNAVLSRLPEMEAKLSSLLNSISIVRKEKRHGTVMAEEYELMLNKLINTLRKCQDHVRESFQSSDLSSLQLVVDGEASPLALSPSGQFLIPASIPGTLVVDFISTHQHEALTLSQEVQLLLKDEKEMRLEAKRILELSSLDKDESVSPSQMAFCCQRLIEQSWTFAGSLVGCSVRISHYYSVMQDGEICLPWDWVGTEDH